MEEKNREIFEKYTDMIDMFGEVQKEELEKLYQMFVNNKETVMLRQYIEEKGIRRFAANLLKVKFQEKAKSWIPQLSEYTVESLEKIGERIILEDSLENIFRNLEKKEEK